jgi:hypothetical protein
MQQERVAIFCSEIEVRVSKCDMFIWVSMQRSADFRD